MKTIVFAVVLLFGSVAYAQYPYYYSRSYGVYPSAYGYGGYRPYVTTTVHVPSNPGYWGPQYQVRSGYRLTSQKDRIARKKAMQYYSFGP